FKEEAVSLIYELNNAKNLQAVYKFNKKELPDFYLIAEQTSAMFSDQLLKVEMFKNNQETFNQIADIHEKWRNNLREFLNVTKSHFTEHCKKNNIEEELFTKWYNEWSEIRLSIERHIEPLIKAGIEKVLPFKEIIRISDLTSKFLTDEYDQLYSKQLIPIYQKYAFDKKTGEIHLTLEKESFIQNILSKFRSEIEDVIFDVDTNEGRLFIVRWAQDWYEEQIDNIVTFTANKDISDKIAKDTLKDLHELKQRNFETVLLDKKAYAEANKELTESFNALMFKMRTEAEKK
ncbi:MAG: hypothetical protein RBS16_10080, partial [Candidatus Cloacimonadales bacterium]|nr:hypothetical protein [Candidatus Cloacimonadales bacterium]